MPYADLATARLYYEVSGPDDGPPLLLIHGLGAQMVMRPTPATWSNTWAWIRCMSSASRWGA